MHKSFAKCAYISGRIIKSFFLSKLKSFLTLILFLNQLNLKSFLTVISLALQPVYLGSLLLKTLLNELLHFLDFFFLMCKTCEVNCFFNLLIKSECLYIILAPPEGFFSAWHR